MDFLVKCICENCGEKSTNKQLFHFGGDKDGLIKELTNNGITTVSKLLIHNCKSGELGICRIVGFIMINPQMVSFVDLILDEK
jgi:hypothetical protein